MEKIDLSIIILSYNTQDLLKKCLQSVEKARKGDYQVEIIVVDNASTDGSPEMVEEFAKKHSYQFVSPPRKTSKEKSAGGGPIRVNSRKPTIKLIISETNLGYAGGNNLGLKKAKGDYILFLNSDTEIKPNALTEMIKFMNKNPKVGASSVKTMLFTGGMDPDCHRGFPTPWASISFFLGLEKLFPKSRLFGQYHKFYLNLGKVHEIDAGFGTFMFVRKKALEQAGNWDDQYFFYGEDLDLFYRIKEAGWKVMFYPKPLVTHHKGASSGLRKESEAVAKPSRETRIKVAKSSIKAMEIFYKKFYQDKYPRWLTFLIIFGIRIKGLYRIALHYIKR